jgi:glycosyltransferase involved in cell wall biosynthesis
MKVLVISNMYPEGKSYFGIFVKKQMESLEKEGVEIIKVVRKSKTFLSYLSFIVNSFIQLSFKSYDIIHAHYGFHSALIPTIIRKKPLIVTYHGSDAKLEPFRNKVYFVLQKFTINRADHLIAVSNDVRDTLINKLHANPGKISVISCGVDTSKFNRFDKIRARKKLGIPLEKKIVLFVGRIEMMKGVDLLYECAQTMPDILFILVGEGQFRRELENWKFVGGRPHGEMPLWMNASDVFVLPSRSEGTPVVILEAFACGIPVVASNVGGCPDLIKDGLNGYIIEVNVRQSSASYKQSGEDSVAPEVVMLKERIECLLENDEKRYAMGREGRETVINEYDDRKIAQKIKRIYTNVRSLS